jgi:hypothetical protein
MPRANALGVRHRRGLRPLGIAKVHVACGQLDHATKFPLQVALDSQRATGDCLHATLDGTLEPVRVEGRNQHDGQHAHQKRDRQSPGAPVAQVYSRDIHPRMLARAGWEDHPGGHGPVVGPP